MNNNENILEVKKLNTSFIVDRKEIRIIKNVSFNLRRAKTLAIVGESGCGKSVTANSIVKLLPKNAITYSNDIVYRSKNESVITEYHLSKLEPYGTEIRKLRGSKISMIFQDPMASLNPVYKVGNQVVEGLLHHNKLIKKEATKIALQLFRELGIPDPENRISDYPFQFSGGMKQRVMIAIAMICDPEIIIADEPTTALDVTIQAQIMELLKELQISKGKSIILITHNMGLVAEMADDVCVMYMGRVVEFGTANRIFNNHSHPYTTALMRSVPVLGLEEGVELQTIPGSTPNASDILIGCEFAERCPFAQARCRVEDIKSYEIEPGHYVRCILYDGNKEVD